MVLTGEAKGTLAPLGLERGDALRFVLRDARPREMTLLATSAQVLECGCVSHHGHHMMEGDIAVYGFDCDLRINGRQVHLRRYVGSQESFYEPWEQDGAHLWFDAVSAIFEEEGGFMGKKDWRGGLLCKPHREARFAVQDAALAICRSCCLRDTRMMRRGLISRTATMAKTAGWDPTRVRMLTAGWTSTCRPAPCCTIMSQP